MSDDRYREYVCELGPSVRDLALQAKAQYCNDQPSDIAFGFLLAFMDFFQIMRTCSAGSGGLVTLKELGIDGFSPESILQLGDTH